jgi:modulator of FtsH protease HflC
MEILRQRADRESRQIGIQVLDVRIKRVDLPQNVSNSVYDRMEAERKSVANQLRSEGSAAAEKIRADADRQREVIVAEAYKEAQRVKGEGDAKAAEIYSAAYGKNPEFYAFYRSLEAYRNSFKNKSDVMVLEPNSDFLKYMKSSGATGAKAKK